MLHRFSDADRPHLEYPLVWSYTLIGHDAAAVREAVVEHVGDAEHSLRFSRASKTGKYCSLELELLVETEERRLGLYHALHGDARIRMVL